MQINVGNLDRIVRIVIGLILLSLPLWLDSSWRWLGLIGIMPLLTGLAGRCPGKASPNCCLMTHPRLTATARSWAAAWSARMRAT